MRAEHRAVKFAAAWLPLICAAMAVHAANTQRIQVRTVAVLIAVSGIVDDMICGDELPSSSIGVPRLMAYLRMFA